MLDYKKIKKVTHAPYCVNMGFDYLLEWIDKRVKEYHLELEPDFQRGHVWTEAQQIAYMEFLLQGGQSGRDIYFNHPGWQTSYEGEMVLVDGLQRITAIKKFLNDELPVFGGYTFSQIENLSLHDHRLYMNIHVNSLQTRKQILEWYVFMNSGVAHTDEELNRVRRLVEVEK
jgi:hypothetical protein